MHAMRASSAMLRRRELVSAPKPTFSRHVSREEEAVLRHVAERAAQRRERSCAIGTPSSGSALRLEQAREQVEQRALARAGRPTMPSTLPGGRRRARLERAARRAG
jgi:hypothetical protein